MTLRKTVRRMSKVEKWEDKVDTELRPLLKHLPPAQLQPWQTSTFLPLINFVLKVSPPTLQVPRKIMKNVKLTTINGIGILLEPNDKFVSEIEDGQEKNTNSNESNTNRNSNQNKKNEKENASAALLWIHGGGRVMGHPKMDLNVTCRLVERLQIPILSVDYRVAPRHPFPAPLDDCDKAYRWLNRTYGATKIIVAGESAGGGLAAELCQRLYDHHHRRRHRHQTATAKETMTMMTMTTNSTASKEEETKTTTMDQTRRTPTAPMTTPDVDVDLPIAQVLIYPMLDDRTVLDQRKTEKKHLLWSNKGNKIGWSAYLGPDYEPGSDDVPRYAAAARRSNLHGLPPALVIACTLDLFYDEDMEYARRLRRDNDAADCDVVVIDGGFHGIMTFGDPDKQRPIEKMYDSVTNYVHKKLLSIDDYN